MGYRQMPVEVVIHPRDLNLVFVAYGGKDQTLSDWLKFTVGTGGVILSNLVSRKDPSDIPD